MNKNSHNTSSYEMMSNHERKLFFLRIAACSILDVLLIAFYSGHTLLSGMKISVPVLLLINTFCFAFGLAPVLGDLKSCLTSSNHRNNQDSH